MQIRLENLTKKFDDTTAVDNVNITFKEGYLTALLGPSGCGKSTILNMIAGILPPTEGSIYFGDEDVKRVPMEKRGVGLVFQNYALYPHMTVKQNICFPLESRKELNKQQREAKAMELARLVKVEELLSRKPSQLSGGQQQRVAIARALAKEPKILLLDEPLSNLDARLRLEMREEIRRIQLETHVTTVFVTHDQEEALSISDEIVLLQKGVVKQVAPPQVLYDEPKNLFAATFLGVPPISLIKGQALHKYFCSGNSMIKWKKLETISEPSESVMGLRAEAIREAKEGEECDFSSVVKSKYVIGKDSLAIIEIDGQPIRFYLSDEDSPLKEGDTVSLKLKSKGVYLFDSTTGDRII